MSPAGFRVYCPAKVNLFLSVGPRDSRGYHPLRTVFQAVGLYDLLDVEFGAGPGGPTEIEIVGVELPAENTVAKVLRLSREVFTVAPVRVRLEKHIPMQSGLGGGSSDAAGVLRALCRLRPVSLEEAESLAAAVGADVPFFLTGGRAIGDRYGDRITPLPDAPKEWYLIGKPPIGCSTAEMFAKLDAEPRPWAELPSADLLFNDFESVAPGPCIDLICRLRELGARDAGLTGSGSAVFGRFGSRERAERASQGLGGADTWIVECLTRAESLRIEGLRGQG